jgi:nucleotide exchange factor SIL1
MAKARAHSERSSHHHPILLLVAVALLLAALILPVASASAAVAVTAAEGDGENRSAAQWATGKDEGELAAEREAAGGGSVVEDDFAGGFGSLDSMLQWAIGTGIPNPSSDSTISSFDSLWKMLNSRWFSLLIISAMQGVA